jgi:hypothetical protein
MEEKFITKKELLNQLRTIPLDMNVSFNEILDIDNLRNERQLIGSRENLIKIIEENFDDDLHGHFNDDVYTTIYAMGVWKQTTTEI